MVEPEAAFESFMGYLETHYSRFDESMRSVCVSVTEKLANAFHGTNKKEVALLGRLKNKLDKLELKELRNKSKTS